MATVGKYPRGFLSLLGLQNFGENPRDVGGVISPVVDIGDQFLVESFEIRTGNNAAGATGFNKFTNNSLIVPQGELWRVFAFSVQVVSGVGASGRFAAAIAVGSTAGVGPRLVVSQQQDYVASQTAFNGLTQLPFWAPAGYELGIELANVAGPAPSCDGGILFARLRA